MLGVHINVYREVCRFTGRSSNILFKDYEVFYLNETCMNELFTMSSTTRIDKIDFVKFQLMLAVQANSSDVSHLSSAIFRPSSSEEESEDEMIALDLIFPLRDGGMRSGLGLKREKCNYN